MHGSNSGSGDETLKLRDRGIGGSGDQTGDRGIMILRSRDKSFGLWLAKSVKLMNKLKHPKEPEMLWFFSDEKIFCQDQAYNMQNNRWVAMNNSDVPRVMKTKFPATSWCLGQA